MDIIHFSKESMSFYKSSDNPTNNKQPNFFKWLLLLMSDLIQKFKNPSIFGTNCFGV